VRGRLAAALAAALLAGCGGDDEGPASAVTGPPAAEAKRADRFDEERAFALVRRQVEVFGQRPAGSPQLRRLAVELRRLLPRGRFEDLRRHPGLRNVVGTIPGRRPAIVIGAHYDTEALPKGFVGANDGAAGTAALVEVARAMRRVKRPAGAPELRFVLFDGEEEPRPTDDFYRDALRGSKDYVARHRREVGAMVLLDYVANRGLRLPREGTSDAGLWRALRSAANRAGVLRYFPDGVGQGFLDDHTPFLRAGIPAIDLIDGEYEHADTLEDTVDKLDPLALDGVGEAVVELLRTLR
jgi:glutaminyl-peptide cyclotransferase